VRRLIFFLLVATWAASSTAFAQDKPVVPDSRPAVVADMVNVVRQAAPVSPTPFQAPVGAGARQLTAAYLIAANAQRTAYSALLQTLEAARMDKQVGAPPASNGGTSLAMKGLAPRIFGVAVERGALTQQVSGTSLTFRANPVGLVKALGGAGLVDLNDDYSTDAVQRFAGRFSLAATFDVSRGTDPGVFTGNDQQFASWAARYAFIDRRDPASPEYAAEWATLLSPSAAPYQKSVENLNDALGRWPAYVKWEQALLKEITDMVETPYASNKNFEAAVAVFTMVLTNNLKKLEALPMTPDVTAALDTYVTELTKVQTSIDAIYKFAGKGPLLTLDVTAARDKNLPDLYTATGVFEAGLGASRKTDFTLNGAFSAYSKTPTGAEHALKSIDITAQLEHPLGRSVPAPTLTFAARYSYLPNDTVASAGAVGGTPATPSTSSSSVGMAPQGHIGFLQAKLTIPIKESGIKVPLSITASNRTELIKEKDVRGSIGITLDLDTFLSVLAGPRR
jgi:hypothetical protein